MEGLGKAFGLLNHGSCSKFCQVYFSETFGDGWEFLSSIRKKLVRKVAFCGCGAGGAGAGAAAAAAAAGAAAAGGAAAAAAAGAGGAGGAGGAAAAAAAAAAGRGGGGSSCGAGGEGGGGAANIVFHGRKRRRRLPNRPPLKGSVKGKRYGAQSSLSKRTRVTWLYSSSPKH